VLIVFSGDILAAFSKNDPSVVAIGSRTLILNAGIFIGFGFQAVYSTYFLALGMAKEGALISIGRQGAFFIPIVFLCSAIFGLNGIIAAQPLADLCSFILVVILSKTSSLNLTNSPVPLSE
jgi:Na+-driven multidrug efflux pump